MDDIVRIAKAVHGEIWHMSGDTSTGTKAAIAATKKWQQEVLKLGDPAVHIEYSIGGGLGEKIDVANLVTETAYEMKVSPNNTHFEFYRDIFKILAHNEVNTHRQLKTLVFITPEGSAAKVRDGLGKIAAQVARKLAVTVIVEGI
jgi:H2-forming N5,N10-methylenetetrahydromethanopterin dehydrogenase-like enzyme